ncbi:MAG: hypothetical protein JXA18_06345 [Chitinispirillaceae bacterium]|nr:hypothetical protein [Chitinispirillaceae bacterium]
MMKREVLPFLAGVSVAAFALAGCGDGGTGPDDAPAFSNVSEFAPFYVAYLSPDPFEKPDTVKVSFDYNSAKIKSIKVTGTLDSGTTWIPVASITPQSSNKASIVWVPFTDMVHFSYFGVKQCRLKIEDPLSDAGCATDSFDVVGNIPFMLTAPEEGEVFRISDSITVFYAQNQDLTARLAALVFPDINDDSTSVSLPNPTLLPNSRDFIRYLQTTFSLDDPRFNYDTAAMPNINIMVADYGTQVVQKVSGPITITR